ncbi:sericin-2-like [Uranotaenia lowii]|uniref:sericin-2-like n=1 Tax=Uranotaenia lowii TaxID=190385 RepID=UPI00247A314A|nr:sericin-2-like [Uranotaenia lowii]
MSTTTVLPEQQQQQPTIDPDPEDSNSNSTSPANGRMSRKRPRESVLTSSAPQSVVGVSSSSRSEDSVAIGMPLDSGNEDVSSSGGERQATNGNGVNRNGVSGVVVVNGTAGSSSSSSGASSVTSKRFSSIRIEDDGMETERSDSSWPPHQDSIRNGHVNIDTDSIASSSSSARPASSVPPLSSNQLGSGVEHSPLVIDSDDQHVIHDLMFSKLLV